MDLYTSVSSLQISLLLFLGNKDTHGINSKRLAEVWMDGYKRLFYMHRHDLAVSVLTICKHLYNTDFLELKVSLKLSPH